MNPQTNSQPLTSRSGPLHRCFYALRFSEETNGYLSALIEELKACRTNVRWVPSPNIHLTLRFLGEIDSGQINRAIALLPAPGTTRPFTIGAAGLGAFPLMRAPRVIWAGVDGETGADRDRLFHLQAQTERWAQEIGVPPENRTYSPHITLGRVAPPLQGMKELMDDVIGRECRSPLSTISEVLLLRSRSGSNGVWYEEMREAS